MTSQVLPWYPAPGVQPQGYYHAAAKLSGGRPGLLVDVGAWTNVGGASNGRELAIAAAAAGFKPTQRKMKTPLEIQGVGNGSQRCLWESSIPVAVPVGDGSVSKLFDFESPLVEGSGKDLPLILGLRSMKEKHAVLEMTDGRECLTFPGPGGYKVEWSPGTVHIPLEAASSGHLMIPCAEYTKLVKPTGVEEAASTLHALPVVSTSRSNRVRSDDNSFPQEGSSRPSSSHEE